MGRVMRGLKTIGPLLMDVSLGLLVAVGSLAMGVAVDTMGVTRTPQCAEVAELLDAVRPLVEAVRAESAAAQAGVEGAPALATELTDEPITTPVTPGTPVPGTDVPTLEPSATVEPSAEPTEEPTVEAPVLPQPPSTGRPLSGGELVPLPPDVSTPTSTSTSTFVAPPSSNPIDTPTPLVRPTATPFAVATPVATATLVATPVATVMSEVEQLSLLVAQLLAENAELRAALAACQSRGG